MTCFDQIIVTNLIQKELNKPLSEFIYYIYQWKRIMKGEKLPFFMLNPGLESLKAKQFVKDTYGV